MEFERLRESADGRQLEKGIIGILAALVMAVLSVVARVVTGMSYEYCMIRYAIDMVPIVTYLVAIFMLAMIPDTAKLKIALVPGVLSIVSWVVSAIKDYRERFYVLREESSMPLFIWNMYTIIAVILLVISLCFVYAGIVAFFKAKEQELNFKSLTKLFLSVNKKTLWTEIIFRIVAVLAICALYITVLYINTGKLYDKAYDIWAHLYLNEEYSGEEDLSKFENPPYKLEGYIVDDPSFVIKNYNDVITDQNNEYSESTRYKRVLNVKKENIELIEEESHSSIWLKDFGYKDIAFFAPFYKDKVVKNGLYLITLDDGVKVGFSANINMINYILATEEERVNLPGSFLLDSYEGFGTVYWNTELLNEQNVSITYASALSGYGWDSIVNNYCIEDYSRVCLADFMVASLLMLIALVVIGLKGKEYYIM